jgi:hypothetical protein
MICIVKKLEKFSCFYAIVGLILTVVGKDPRYCIDYLFLTVCRLSSPKAIFTPYDSRQCGVLICDQIYQDCHITHLPHRRTLQNLNLLIEEKLSAKFCSLFPILFINFANSALIFFGEALRLEIQRVTAQQTRVRLMLD